MLVLCLQFLNPKKIDAFLFEMTLAESLVRPSVEQRSRNGLNKPILSKISLFTGEIPAPPPAEKLTKFKKYGEPLYRWSTSLEEIVGKNHKEKKIKKSKVCANTVEKPLPNT